MVIEKEVRFGTFTQNGKQFRNIITPQQFNDVYYYLEQAHGKPVTKNQHIEMYGTVKKITEDNKVTYMTKKKLQNQDNTEYNFRISMSEETILQKPDISNKKLTYEERRTRYTFKSEKLKLVFDLNISQSGENSLEMECLPGCDDKVFNDMITILLQILQESEVLITNTEKNEVIAKYKKITKKSKFSGVQPVTISADKIKKNSEYTITKKLDGRRFLLMAYLNNVYAISTKLTVHKLPFVNKYMDNAIFDSEFFRNAYHIFDLMDEIPFQDRMEKIKKIYGKFEPYKGTNMNIYIKKYESSDNFSEMFNKLSVGLDEKIYDGLIIMDKNATYSKSKPYKWKPPHMNTVDFKIKKKDNKVFELYVTDKSGLVQFAETDVSQKDYDTYADNSVVEFKYNKKWIPIKPRFDKENPNFISIAEDNLNATKYPFVPQVHSTALHNMRRFHNYVKRYIIDKYRHNNGGNVLDLACGKGGDLHKYINSNFTYIEGYDINELSVKEAKHRASQALQSNKNKNLDIVLKVQDLNKTPVVTNKKFDMVVCNFAFHYMYKKMDLFLKNVANNTQSGAILVLSFFDNSLVRNIKTEDYEVKKSGSDKVCVWIKDSVLDKKEEEHIVELPKVISYFTENGFSLLENTNFSEFYKAWKNKDKSNVLSKEEQDLSFMNISLVFIKN